MVANRILAEKRGISPENINKIDMYHELVETLEVYIGGMDAADISFAVALWHDFNFELQRLWGFKQDKRKHPSWHIPHCTCPKMDNDDYGYYMCVTRGCPIHNPLPQKELKTL